MNRLNLDFAPRGVRYWWFRAGLPLRAALVGAGLVLTAGLWWVMALQSERLQLQEALARTAPAASQAAQALQDRASAVAKGDQAVVEAQHKAMNQALRALNRPWFPLWDALERVSAAPGIQVAILEIRPDTAASEQETGEPGLRLLAESKDSAHMLGFMRQLRNEPFFVSAVLTSHQVNAQDPNKPLRFDVWLRWMEASP